MRVFTLFRPGVYPAPLIWSMKGGRKVPDKAAEFLYPAMGPRRAG